VESEVGWQAGTDCKYLRLIRLQQDARGGEEHRQVER